MPRPLVRSCLLGAFTCIAVLARSSQAQQPAGPPAAVSPPPTERIDPSLTGLARARALATLVDRSRNDRPAEAIAYGREALDLFARHPDPRAQVATLNEMAWAYMTLGRYEEASAHANYGIVLADSTGDLQGKARAMSNLGTLAQRRGDPEEAVARFARALELQRELGLARDVATSLNNLGFVYSTDLAQYDVALEHHHDALAVRERLGDSSTIALSLNNIGIVHARMGQHPLARSYYERALAIRRALAERARIAATLDNIAESYRDEGDLPRALASHRDSYLIRRTIDDPSALATAHRNLGSVYAALGLGDSARVHLTEALRLGEAMGDHGLRVRNLLALAAFEQRLGRVIAAESLSRRALQVAEAMPSRDLVRRALESLAAAQEARGEYRAALATHRRFKATSDSIFTEGTGRRIAGLERKYEAVRRERALAALQRAEAEQALTAQRRTVQRNSFAALALLLAIGLYLVHRRRTERTALAEELSVTDPLTGVRNRRFVQQTIASDVSGVARRHRASPPGVVPADSDVVFLLIDIDHFKRVNDQYGHAAGDRLLQAVARQLTAILRDSDVVARWGGEEFLVVSRFTNRDRAPELAERIRRKIETLETTLPGGAVIRVTCSIGFAAFPFSRSAPESVGWEGVVSIADLACYAAKRDGRNAWATFRAAQTEAGDVSLNDVTLADIDARVRDGRIVLDQSRALVDEPA